MDTIETVTEPVEAVVTRQFDAINRHDPEAFASGYSTEAVVSDPMHHEPLRGRDAIAKDFADFFLAFPDLTMTMKEMLTKGDSYAVEYVMSGSHRGPIVGPAGAITATNKRIDVCGSAFGRLDDQHRITEERRYFDIAGMMTQLGISE